MAKPYINPKAKELNDLINKYKWVLGREEIFEILMAGHSIFKQGSGLSWIEAREILGLPNDSTSTSGP